MKQQDKLSECASSGLRVPKLLFLIKRPFGLQNTPPPPGNFCAPTKIFAPLSPSQAHYSGVGPEKNDMKTAKNRKLSKRKENSKTISRVENNKVVSAFLHFREKKNKTKIFESILDAKQTVIILSSFHGHQTVWNQIYLRYLYSSGDKTQRNKIYCNFYHLRLYCFRKVYRLKN